MKVRIVTPGWENFTGPMGMGVMFEDGVSVGELSERAKMRIGVVLEIVEVKEDGSSGEQLGATATLAGLRFDDMPTPHAIENGVDARARAQAEHSATEAQARLDAEQAAAAAAAEQAALAAARAKAEAAAPVVYSRAELEAIGANDGVRGLREIGDPMGAKGRSVTELVTAIFNAQSKALTS